MNRALLILICGLLAGHSTAQSSSAVTDTSSPECQDILAVKDSAELALRTVNHSLTCSPTQNCTGLNCSGVYHKKPFNGTVVLQGCQEPVLLLVHVKNKKFLVKDGDKRKIWPKLYLFTHLKKLNNTVHVSIYLRTCLSADPKTCIMPIPLVKDRRIRLNCNGSAPVIPWSKPTRLPYTGGPSLNPECKGLTSTKKVIERNFAILNTVFPGSSISCSTEKNCSELRCSGVSKKDDFTTTMAINYCSSPITMKLVIDVPKKKLHVNHDFKDGEKITVSRVPPISVTVHLKRVVNTIYVTVSLSAIFVDKDLVKNMSITVDPSHCHGYHYPTHVFTEPINPQCKHLQALDITIEKKFSKLGQGEPGAQTFINCRPDKVRCTELRCSGKYRNTPFTTVVSLNYCTSPVSLHMATLTKGKHHIHEFKDGDTCNMPLPTTVGLKRMGNHIAVNISINKLSLVDNLVLPVDPKFCSSASGKSKSLSKGAIAGIIIAVVVVVALLVVVVIRLRRGKPLTFKLARYKNLSMSNDTDPLYDDFEPAVA